MRKIKFYLAAILLSAGTTVLLNGCGSKVSHPTPSSYPNYVVTPSASQQTNPQPVNIPVNTNQPQAVPVVPTAQPGPTPMPPGQR